MNKSSELYLEQQKTSYEYNKLKKLQNPLSETMRLNDTRERYACMTRVTDAQKQHKDCVDAASPRACRIGIYYMSRS